MLPLQSGSWSQSHCFLQCGHPTEGEVQTMAFHWCWMQIGIICQEWGVVKLYFKMERAPSCLSELIFQWHLAKSCSIWSIIESLQFVYWFLVFTCSLALICLFMWYLYSIWCMWYIISHTPLWYYISGVWWSVQLQTAYFVEHIDVFLNIHDSIHGAC